MSITTIPKLKKEVVNELLDILLVNEQKNKDSTKFKGYFGQIEVFINGRGKTLPFKDFFYGKLKEENMGSIGLSDPTFGRIADCQSNGIKANFDTKTIQQVKDFWNLKGYDRATASRPSGLQIAEKDENNIFFYSVNKIRISGNGIVVEIESTRIEIDMTQKNNVSHLSFPDIELLKDLDSFGKKYVDNSKKKIVIFSVDNI